MAKFHSLRKLICIAYCNKDTYNIQLQPGWINPMVSLKPKYRIYNAQNASLFIIRLKVKKLISVLVLQMEREWRLV